MATSFTRLTRTILGGVFAAAVLASVLAAPPPAVELRGRILGDGGKPLAGATVRVLATTPPEARGKAVRVETGNDGAFVAPGLPGSVFRVRVEAKGYAPLTEGQIPGGATLRLKLKRGGMVTGVVLDRVTRKPIDAATILAWEKDAEIWGEESYRSAKSARDGRFIVSDLAEGRVTVEARAAGRATAKTVGAASQPAPLLLLLDPEGSLTGLVTDTAGAPVVGADVAAFWRDATGPRSRKAKTDAEGHYAVAAAGDVAILRMAVRAAGFPVFEREGPTPRDGIVDFVLERGGTIAGIVKTAAGKTPPSFRVSTRLERSGPRIDREFADPSGAFRIEDLDPGTYTIEVAAERFATLTKAEVAIRGEQVADLGTLTLESKSTLRGRVLYARDESPVAGASVRVSLVDATAENIVPGAETLWTASSSADGSFSIRGLGSGTFDVKAEQSAFSPASKRMAFDPEADTPELVLHMYRGGVLTGTVIDAKSEPVPSVRIVASPGPEADARVADTGTDGRYYMDALTPGAYQVTRQQAEGARPAGQASKLATIVEGETTTVDFDEAPKILLSGIVRKGEEPLPNASIYLFALDGRVPANVKKAQADARGAYRVGLDQGGRYQASVRMGTSGTAFGQNIVTFTIPEQSEVQQDIVFAINAIVGRITTPEGKNIKGAIVLAVKDGAPRGETPRQSSTTSGADGTFRMDGIDAGVYRVSARATGFAPAEQYPVAVSDEQPEAEVDLTLERGWIMLGRVVGPDGQPIGDAVVVVAPPGAVESGFIPSHTDSAGRFKITSPVDGPINVAAISPRFAPAVQTDVQPPGPSDPPEVELRATAGGALRIRVMHRGGAPVAGVQAAFRPVTPFPGSDLVTDRNRPQPTDADGITIVPRLYPGEYLVSLVGRKDVSPARVVVGEGAETPVQIEVP